MSQSSFSERDVACYIALPYLVIGAVASAKLEGLVPGVPPLRPIREIFPDNRGVLPPVVKGRFSSP